MYRYTTQGQFISKKNQVVENFNIGGIKMNTQAINDTFIKINQAAKNMFGAKNNTNSIIDTNNKKYNPTNGLLSGKTSHF